MPAPHLSSAGAQDLLLGGSRAPPCLECSNVRGMELTTQETSSQLRGDKQKLLLAKGEIGLKRRKAFRVCQCAAHQRIIPVQRTPWRDGLALGLIGSSHVKLRLQVGKRSSNHSQTERVPSPGPRSTSGPRGLHRHHAVHIRSTHPGGVLACCGTRCLHVYRPGVTAHTAVSLSTKGNVAALAELQKLRHNAASYTMGLFSCRVPSQRSTLVFKVLFILRRR
ncbi:unnamed protein product [Boreogadus saida]